MNIGMHNHCVLLLPVFKHRCKNKHPISIGTRNHTYKIRELKVTVKDPLASSLAGRGSPLDLTEIRRLRDPLLLQGTTYNLKPTKTRKYKQRHQTIITHLAATSYSK